jgi:hypothetical protein
MMCQLLPDYQPIEPAPQAFGITLASTARICFSWLTHVAIYGLLRKTDDVSVIKKSADQAPMRKLPASHT